MSNIVVSGYYGSKNAGDEAMLAAMIEVLSALDPQLDITVISADPEETRNRHQVKAVPWLRVGEIAAALRRADLMISGGGSLLQNVTSGRSLYYYLSVIFLARLLGTPVMLYAQGIGPVCGAFPRWLMRLVGNRVSLITVRDHGSLDELESLAIRRPPIRVTADPVLAISPVDRSVGRAILDRFPLARQSPLVGISVREWRGWDAYKEAIAQAADSITQEYGARIVFLPMQYPEDVHAAESIAARMREKALVLPGEYMTGELLSLVGCLDLLIAIRLHALIFAGVMGVPMLGISYDPKIDRFLNSIGEHPVGDLQKVTAADILAGVRAKWAGRHAYREKNAALLASLRSLAYSNAEMAMDFIRAIRQKATEPPRHEKRP